MQTIARCLAGFFLLISLSEPIASASTSGNAFGVAPAQAASTESFLALAAGGSFACGLTSAQGVVCWGDNEYGQLGDGTTDPHGAPQNVSGLTSGVKAISAGFEHACALMESGTIKCWGYNRFGELGDGTLKNSLTPVDVVGLPPGMIAVAVGDSHTCALTSSGGVLCWGNNIYGQLGNGTTTNSSIPVEVTGLSSGVKVLAAGGSYTCALTSPGGVECWGNNNSGQLGDGTFNSSPTPVQVSGLTSGVTQITTGGSHSCAVISSGLAFCWGANNAGQIGNNSTTKQNTPQLVAGFNSSFQEISAYGWHTCALTSNGGVQCWGANESGEIGDGTTTTRLAPVVVSGLPSGAQAVVAGGDFSCALLTSGGAKCWGSNTSGELGADAKPAMSRRPVNVTGLSNENLSIALGVDVGCAQKASGDLACWGINDSGQLGNLTVPFSSTPLTINNLGGNVRQVSIGERYICVLVATSPILARIGAECWGNNHSGQLGDGSQTSRPTPGFVSGLKSGVLDLSAGSDHACAAINSGGLVCWGSNAGGDLGNGMGSSSSVPVIVFGYATGGAISISAGDAHTCAITASGGVQCWGYNHYGQIGVDPTSTPFSNVPVDVTGMITGTTTVAAGSEYSCALTDASGVKCWGDNSSGQLGNGSAADSYQPQDVIGLTSGITQITVGSESACALTSTGGVKCWGDNTYGELGSGTQAITSTVPVDIVGLAGSVKQVAVGLDSACALLVSGTVQCWGSDWSGQLGDGRLLQSLTPVDVLPPGANPPGSFRDFLPVIMTHP